jgi:hypothetical protein
VPICNKFTILKQIVDKIPCYTLKKMAPSMACKIKAAPNHGCESETGTANQPSLAGAALVATLVGLLSMTCTPQIDTDLSAPVMPSMVQNNDTLQQQPDIVPTMDVVPSSGYSQPIQDCSRVNVNEISAGLKIFPEYHPIYSKHPDTLNKALNTLDFMVTVAVDLHVDTDYWTPEDVIAFSRCVNNYYEAANIRFLFTCSTYASSASEPLSVLSRRIPSDSSAILRLYFTDNLAGASGEVSDGFGNLPSGTAVINHRIVARPVANALPNFNTVKPMGHELGHVLGLAHTSDKINLMCQGTSADNSVKLLPEQIVIVRFMALYRYRAVAVPSGGTATIRANPVL